ncbi:MAG: GAF domain-containing protein, partial [Deltaproteobacteria bacterium]|nr:GAF domain-containing protein [Deltaproteobacteria bacterium]
DRGTDQKGALACVPIVSEGSCIGVVNFRDNFPGTFEPNDLRIFELVADQLSITASLVRTYLDLLALEKKRMNLSRYFSRGLAEHLLADERMNRLGGQQINVTVIFADIAGFSSLVESQPVEDVVGVLNQFFATVVPVIFKHEGMLDKFLGDGVMAVFGIPDADAKDSLKAIECAMEIQKKVKALSKSLEKQGLTAIDVGIGIATGDVLAGNIGTEEQMNYTVIGEPVNLAQRLESISSPGEIVVSKLTLDRAQAYAKRQIQFESIGAVKVKGIQRKISAMRVIS